MAEASPSSGVQANSKASDGEQEGMFQKGVPVTSLGHCYLLYPLQIIFVSLLSEPPLRRSSREALAKETEQELQRRPLGQD